MIALERKVSLVSKYDSRNLIASAAIFQK